MTFNHTFLSPRSKRFRWRGGELSDGGGELVRNPAVAVLNFVEENSESKQKIKKGTASQTRCRGYCTGNAGKSWQKCKDLYGT